MSSDPIAICVANLGKCYQIYDRPQDRLKQSLVPRLRRLLKQPAPNYYREFWALRDVSFEIRQGETVGIIGRNGSGKSTLLQIICGTLTPSTGTVAATGRVAALLELGSGFNPEFTGRENVYLNGSVLGLSREEIDARFDDIAAFADIGDFIEQPVKMYSSGMYVRLAFAVAVNVDADVLVVDEALSVGDMFFQAKCMAHLQKQISSGVSVLFVSHDVGAVKSLCSKALYLDHGQMVAFGRTAGIVDAYYGAAVRSQQLTDPTQQPQPHQAPPPPFDDRELADQEAFLDRARFQRIQNGKAEFLNVKLVDSTGAKLDIVHFGQSVTLRMLFKANIDLSVIGLAYHIRDHTGYDVIYSDTGIENCHLATLEAAQVVQTDWQFTIRLREGDYSVSAMLSIPEDLEIAKVEVCDFVPIAINFKVVLEGHLPLHGAAYWRNQVTHRIVTQ